jgi:hypothetical protein
MYVKNGQKSVDYVTQDIDIFFESFTSWKMKYFTWSTSMQVAFMQPDPIKVFLFLQFCEVGGLVIIHNST